MSEFLLCLHSFAKSKRNVYEYYAVKAYTHGKHTFYGILGHSDKMQTTMKSEIMEQMSGMVRSMATTTKYELAMQFVLYFWIILLLATYFFTLFCLFLNSSHHFPFLPPISTFVLVALCDILVSAIPTQIPSNFCLFTITNWELSSKKTTFFAHILFKNKTITAI